MDATQFENIQEALMYVFQPFAFWWLVGIFAAGMIQALIMVGLGLARWIMGRGKGFPQRPMRLP